MENSVGKPCCKTSIDHEILDKSSLPKMSKPQSHTFFSGENEIVC